MSMMQRIIFVLAIAGIALTPNPALGQSPYECGSIDVTGAGDEAETCFETYFSACLPAKVVVSGNGEVAERTILGMKGDACEVQTTFLQSTWKDFKGHSMICVLPQDLKYFSRNILAPGELARCSGELVPAYGRVQTEMQKQPSAEEMFYSNLAKLPSKEEVQNTKMKRLRGRILIATERNGEAWYVRPKDSKAVFLGRPADAFAVMRSSGIGIKNSDMDSIPLAYETLRDGTDTDGDGLSDRGEAAIGTDPAAADTDGDGYADGLEVMNGYSPTGAARIATNKQFASRHAGVIFLAVQRNGEAWYVHPTELRRYYLGKPSDAFAIMKKTGMGITDVDFADIPRVK
ncbi:hypothetical protein HY622_02190 [Candidatus Uhrbacteria bacterium]|nr:hypothetical protein [Candidatus Uhrbacteria bacterium]